MRPWTVAFLNDRKLKPPFWMKKCFASSSRWPLKYPKAAASPGHSEFSFSAHSSKAASCPPLNLMEHTGKEILFKGITVVALQANGVFPAGSICL